MDEPFSVDLENPQGVSLTPSALESPTATMPPPPAPSPQDLAVLPPSVADVLGPRPAAAMPAPPAPPPSPMADPRQQLAALVALGLAIGQGPRAGGAGALQGFAQTQQALRADQLAQYQKDVQQYEQQRQQAAQTQRKLETEYDQRAERLRTTLLNFDKAVQAKPDDEDYYRQQVALYSTALRAAGYRTMTPQWFYENFRFTPPTELDSISRGLTNYFNSPAVKEIAKQNPQAAFQGTIAYRVPGQRLPAHMPVMDALRRTGQQPGGLNPDGSLAVTPVGTGTEYADSIQRATAEYTARFGRPPRRDDATANDWIAKRADQLRAKPRDPIAEELAQARLDEIKNKNKAIDVTDNITTTISGRRYVDLSEFQTPEVREKARQAAQAAGVMAVNKDTAEGLKAADNAKLNLQSMLLQIKDKLPKDPSGRLLSAPGNKLGQFFQTDAALGAWNSWRTAAIQAVQALSEKGMGLRLNRAEIDLMLQNDIPQLTDDLPTAEQRVKNLYTLLEDKEKSALVRDRSTLSPQGSQPSSTPTQDLNSALDKLRQRRGRGGQAQ